MSYLTPDRRQRAEKTVALYPQARSALIPLCHIAQEQDGYLTQEAMVEVAALVGVTPAEVRGTATFYDMLHTEPVGSYLVGVCTNIACLLAGGAFYLFPNISSFGLKDVDFCAKLLEQEKVAAVPGSAFGAEGYLRLSYATSDEIIAKGLVRLARFCAGLKRSG